MMTFADLLDHLDSQARSAAEQTVQVDAVELLALIRFTATVLSKGPDKDEVAEFVGLFLPRNEFGNHGVGPPVPPFIVTGAGESFAA
jgi:hypothetical protein